MSQKNTKLGLAILSIVLGMVMFSYAFVPLYNIFCKLTGYGGTTQQAIKTSDKIGHKKLIVRFDANVADDLPWEFKPLQNQVEVVTGENVLVYYSAKNKSSQPITGTAVYNVTPHKVGIYFNKIQCFCFQEQLLKPNEEVLMPVTFFIDPSFDDDRDVNYLDQITLSYSFFLVKD